MKFIAAPARASEAECLRPPNRAMLTADAALYAMIGMIFGSGNSRAATRASAHDLMECPDGNASPPAVSKQFILNVDRSVLENAPGFDKDNWPDIADPQFGTNVYRHYGYKPYWEDVA